MRTITLRKAVWDANLAVFFDRNNDPRTKKFGGNSANPPISAASIGRLCYLLEGKTPTVDFGTVGLIVRYSFPDRL